ncbi:zinc finger-containing ubiquitin peptidase 1-like [Dreissena polymorpha]|uniref:Zinc finger-containing ubiquitin peptidase 1 n=1 Tax=Dreissena polymorpha TaxID=45954 RepID=A0A9D4HZ64_DREPO|nr:zinc finger-containing ubiquitin peptidase 1-like [Dreissena polymorpha]KAH3738294.1 hypothetical protein DPMN_044927 [Dreissena polymorpha]
MAAVHQSHKLLGEKFTCLVCGQEGLDEASMRTHVQLEHVENNNCCPFCDLAGITSDEMTMHINAVHFDDVSQWSNNKKLEADVTDKKEDPEKFGKEHGGAIPKNTERTLKHSHSLERSPHRSPSRKSGIPTSQSESNLHRRGQLKLNFNSVNEPGRSISASASTETLRALTSSTSVRTSMSAHLMQASSSIEGIVEGDSTPEEMDQSSASCMRPRIHGRIQSQNSIPEESHDNNNVPLQPNLNQALQPDINDNIEPDINSNMPASFLCPLCQFITSSESVIQAHVNMAHVDVLSPARPRTTGINHMQSNRSSKETIADNSASTSQSGASNILEDEYLCPICSQTFYNTATLSLHVNQDHAQIFSPGRPLPDGAEASEPVAGPSSFHCPVCAMEFYDRGKLEAHVNGHFSAEQTPVQERTDKLIAQALQEKEEDIAKHAEKEEFHKLQAMYGMVEGTPYKKKFEKNLEKAVAKGDMTVVEFQERKNGFKFAEARGVDDGASCTKGIIQRLQEYYRGPTHGVARAYLCTIVDHYAGSYGDTGWGCGYRNFQMLLSALMTEPTYCKVLFNDKPVMPSIPKIQRLIEGAWEKGFDKQGCDQLGGRVFNTEKWIGATEIVATLASLNIKCRLLDFHKPTGPNGTHPQMFEWVKNYFQKASAFKPPLYLQHQGHSRTIIGIEELKDKHLRLLLFDPSVRKKQMTVFHSIVNANIMKTLRKPLEYMKSKQYQIVAVTGILSEQDYQEAKILRSEKIS